MKSLDSDKKAGKSGAVEEATANDNNGFFKDNAKIDFSNVKVEPLFEEEVDFDTFIIELKRTKQKAIIGFISDQAPKWNSIHHWTEFLNQETPVFIGTEKIGKQVDALIYYADVTRVKRGYYHCRLKPLCDTPRQVPDFELTDLFTRELEQTIKAHPQYWLWSHNRWKRTKEEWLRRQQEETK